MNILLVESHYRTRSWYLAMRGLSDIYVISTMPEERNMFLSYGVPEENILNLHHPNLNDLNSEMVMDQLQKAEIRLNISINEIVLMDRTLRKKSQDYISKYMLFILTEIENFVTEKHINIAFLEPTWAHDILTDAICSFYKTPVLSPRNDRFLKNRFIFFKGCLFNDYFVRNPGENGNATAKSTVRSVLSLEKPRYFHKFSARNKFRLNKFLVLFRITRLAVLGLKNNNIQPSLWDSVRKKIVAITKVYYFSKFGPFVKLNELGSKFVLVTLHVQPESSIDVVGAPFSNQLEFVRQCVRTTPANYTLVVKEHPHAVGNRPNAFYDEILSMPGTAILDPFEDSKMAIQRASLVISITGTSSYEAAIMGIPSVTAVEMFFQDVLIKRSFNPALDSIGELIRHVDTTQMLSRNEIIAKIGKIQNNVFPGNVQDCKTDPDVLSEENIENLRNAFSEVVNFYQNRIEQSE